MDPTVVDDAEDLYRSIRANTDEYFYQDGKLVFSSSAFDDRFMKPSVDRSSLRHNPADARINITDGVAKVLADDVRRSCKIPIIRNGVPVGEYAVDAVHRPIENDQDVPDNLAHCQIECNPIIESGSRFKKLKAALANLATKHSFIVPPS
ncbi:hypothetical protein XI09_05345 [Bradyrhizobium sp. CCBAU 11386]|uniref:hypothetical protein n=1 Tax=Bradyrhizobium sp. CCBAU 11386 TaxID=1630837 RepID=UPI0023036C5E|nr:hypothetical protein [Bradyrhizobium sp. CCBAU 11386]MDA9504195.1 hypothetical protein [Bradyrhizobium sp. CCBAU 11386]